MDITKIIPSPNFSTVVKYAEKQNLPLIVGSDTNARHKLWGNKDSNTRGEELLDFLSSCGLSWANKGSTPTFINSRGHNSIIDLTLTNNKGGDEIGGWHVRDIYWNSDHQYIMFDISSKNKSNPKQVRFTKNTDWDLFHEHLSSNLKTDSTELFTTHDIDTACEKLNKHTIKAFNYACPVTYISSSIKKPTWLTTELQKCTEDHTT